MNERLLILPIIVVLRIACVRTQLLHLATQVVTLQGNAVSHVTCEPYVTHESCDTCEPYVTHES